VQEYRMAGCRTLAEAELYGSEKKKRDTEAIQRKARESASYLYSGKSTTHRANRYLNREKEGEAASSGSAREVPKGRVGPPLLPSGSSLLAGSGGKDSKRSGVPLDLAGSPGVELLSHSVRQPTSSNSAVLVALYMRLRVFFLTFVHKMYNCVDAFDVHLM